MINSQPTYYFDDERTTTDNLKQCVGVSSNTIYEAVLSCQLNFAIDVSLLWKCLDGRMISQNNLPLQTSVGFDEVEVGILNPLAL